MEEERAGLWGHLGALTAVKCHALMFHIATSTVLNSVSADSYWNGQLSFWSSDFLLKFLFWSAGLFDLGALENFSAITFKIYYKWLKYGYYKFTESMYRRYTATSQQLLQACVFQQIRGYCWTGTLSKIQQSQLTDSYWYLIDHESDCYNVTSKLLFFCSKNKIKLSQIYRLKLLCPQTSCIFVYTCSFNSPVNRPDLFMTFVQKECFHQCFSLLLLTHSFK